MKTAIYIEDGLTQLVLTPETDFESHIVQQVEKGGQEVKVHSGEFFRNQANYIVHPIGWKSRDESLIITMKIKE
ncbi:hypothetical protein LCGC14_1935610 [marine sediment metagenome]|uniref:Uncharacterized protein n=1 Tax=marine sediment metagenome TaxID=412755 RepID=A0A0F9FM72_9ZZZZ